MKLMIGDVLLWGHFLLTTEQYNGDALMVGFLDRSKIKVQGAVQMLGNRRIRWSYRNYTTNGGECNEWTGGMQSVSMGRERFTYCCATSKAVGKRFVLTTQEDEDEDFYNYFMHNCKLPLLKWWTPFIKEALLRNDNIKQKNVYLQVADGISSVALNIGGKEILIHRLKCYEFLDFSNDVLTDIVSQLLRERKIWITQKRMRPLEFSTFDEYVNMYGPSLVDNLNKSILPLTDLKANVDTVAFKEKKLYPQQAACVNGVLAMRNHGIKYAVLNEGMGVGKTIQALAVMEGAKVEEYLKTHPGAVLKDAYQPGAVKYRSIIMAPGHLVEKWASEIEKEIPYATATIVRDLSVLADIKREGKIPKGKEFYIISKDSAKLDTLLAPTPSQVKMKVPALRVCVDCMEDEDNPRIVYQKGCGTEACCPTCSGKRFKPYPYGGKRKRGFVCPECGELLLRYKGYNVDSSSFNETFEKAPLLPADFDNKKEENSCCYHCGTSLWGSKSKPLVMGDSAASEKKSKWYRVSHYSNHTHKTKASAYVLSGYEEEYKRGCTTTEGWSKHANEYGPRRTSLARYVKKQMKGYFDFCVLDECHKYFGESAQSVAAHQLVKASKFTLALTGTISNGTAKAFYNLFWMFEPKKLLDMGYAYSKGDSSRFCKEYGCVEQMYECKSTNDFTHNVMSRGKAIGSPKIKPGISPVIFGRLLMDRCLFLDISDLSKYLPKFTEKVEIVDVPIDMHGEYKYVIDTLKEESSRGSGMALLSVMLQYGLSFLDKPYGRRPILDPFKEDSLIVRPLNFDEYSGLSLLTPKEERLVEIVNNEIAEGRNCFIYASYTNNEETNVTYRLKELIEKKCNLKGRVEIIQSSSPAASKREEWFHKRASKGIKVFISNPQNVETGLDFCFEHEGRYYNYPTLIFYQTGYNLSVIWQASRRAFRLNQKQECRNYYLAYDMTLQSAALEIMAKKQVATAAIQGHFSTEGLSAMAKGVDARAQLAAALAKEDMADRKTLENMFDALSNGNDEDDERYSGFVPSPSFYEVLGYAKEESVALTGFGSFEDASCESTEDIGFSGFGSLDAFGSFGGFGDFGSFGDFTNTTVFNSSANVVTEEIHVKKKAKSNNKRNLEGQDSLFDMFLAV